MNILQSSSDNGYAIFLWLCLLFFFIWWTPIIYIPLHGFVTNNTIVYVWCGLVVLLSFQMGLSLSDQVIKNLWDELQNTSTEFCDLIRDSSGSFLAFITVILPISGIIFGTGYMYFCIFGNKIFLNPVEYFILLPAIHWFIPLYLGILLRKKSWLSWLSFS